VTDSSASHGLQLLANHLKNIQFYYIYLGGSYNENFQDMPVAGHVFVLYHFTLWYLGNKHNESTTTPDGRLQAGRPTLTLT